MTHLDRLLTELTGIELSRGGLRNSLESFAERRACELGFKDAEAYFSEVARLGSAERQRLFDVISVPHTWFFRDAAQIHAVLQVLKDMSCGARPLRVWVPGCATGEDAYSLALLAESAGLSLRILATDMSQRSLTKARDARYGAFSMRELPSAYSPFFTRQGKFWTLAESVRQRVQFQEHNLMDPPLTTAGGWDLILCRNVVIYFSSSTAANCAERMAQTVHAAGAIFFGAGELVSQAPRGLNPVLVGQRVAFRPATPSEEVPRWAAKAPKVPPMDGARPRPPLGQHEIHGLAGVAPAPRPQPEPQQHRPAEVPGALWSEACRLPEAGRSNQDEGESTVRSDSWTHLLDHGDFSTAAQEVLRASAQAPLDPELRLLSGIALYTAGDYGRGLRELRAALLLDGKLWPAALYQGLCLDGLGANDQAREEYARAARLLEAPDASRLSLPTPLQGLSGDLLEMVRHKARTPG